MLRVVMQCVKGGRCCGSIAGVGVVALPAMSIESLLLCKCTVNLRQSCHPRAGGDPSGKDYKFIDY